MATLPDNCSGSYSEIVLLQDDKKNLNKIKPQTLDLFQSAELLQSRVASQKSGFCQDCFASAITIFNLVIT